MSAVAPEQTVPRLPDGKIEFVVVWLDGDAAETGREYLTRRDLSSAIQWATGRVMRTPDAHGFVARRMTREDESYRALLREEA